MKLNHQAEPLLHTCHRPGGGLRSHTFTSRTTKNHHKHLATNTKPGIKVNNLLQAGVVVVVFFNCCFFGELCFVSRHRYRHLCVCSGASLRVPETQTPAALIFSLHKHLFLLRFSSLHTRLYNYSIFKKALLFVVLDGARSLDPVDYSCINHRAVTKRCKLGD